MDYNQEAVTAHSPLKVHNYIIKINVEVVETKKSQTFSCQVMHTTEV